MDPIRLPAVLLLWLRLHADPDDVRPLPPEPLVELRLEGAPRRALRLTARASEGFEQRPGSPLARSRVLEDEPWTADECPSSCKMPSVRGKVELSFLTLKLSRRVGL